MQVVTTILGLNKRVLHAQASRKFTVGSVIQRDPAPSLTAELKRKQTAAQLLRLLSGRSLEDPNRVRTELRSLLCKASSAYSKVLRYPSCVQENELLAALHFLPVPPAPPRWRALANSVLSFGPAAVQQKLSKTRYIVPDVECAAGLIHF